MPKKKKVDPQKDDKKEKEAFEIPKSEPCTTVAKVLFRDQTIGIVAVLSKADRVLLQSVASEYKEMKAPEIAKLKMTRLPVWEYGKSSASKLNSCEHVLLEDLRKSKITVSKNEDLKNDDDVDESSDDTERSVSEED